MNKRMRYMLRQVVVLDAVRAYADPNFDQRKYLILMMFAKCFHDY